MRVEAPVVSIILAVYNGENFIDQAIQSVFGQTFRDFELIIVDDGSTDGTSQAVEPYLDKSGVIYLQQENGGHAEAMNVGVSRAKGQYLAFIDHDDIWDENKLQLQLDEFERSPDLSAVFTYWKNFAEDEQSRNLYFRTEGIKGYTSGTMLIRRDAFLNVGWFDTNLKKGYFLPWFDRLKMLDLKEHVIEDVLYHRRVHGDNISIGHDSSDYKDYFQALRNIRRQRDQ